MGKLAPQSCREKRQEAPQPARLAGLPAPGLTPRPPRKPCGGHLPPRLAGGRPSEPSQARGRRGHPSGRPEARREAGGKGRGREAGTGTPRRCRRRAGRAPWARCCGGTSCGPAARRWTGARTTTLSCPPSPSSTTRCVEAAAALAPGSETRRRGGGGVPAPAVLGGGPGCGAAGGRACGGGPAGGWSRWSPGGPAAYRVRLLLGLENALLSLPTSSSSIQSLVRRLK